MKWLSATPKRSCERLRRRKYLRAARDAGRSGKARRCFELLERANRGEIELVTSEAVIAETVDVLSSPRLYGMPRAGITSRLGALLAGSRLRTDHKETVLEALDLFANSNLHFVDCLCVAHARRATVPHAVYSDDRGLDRVSDAPQFEP